MVDRGSQQSLVLGRCVFLFTLNFHPRLSLTSDLMLKYIVVTCCCCSDGTELTFYELQRGEPNSVEQACFAMLRSPGFGDVDEPFHWQDTLCNQSLNFIAKSGASAAVCVRRPPPHPPSHHPCLFASIQIDNKRQRLSLTEQTTTTEPD